MAVGVLIAGGGVAALEGLLALRALAGERVELELLTPEREFTYRPLAVAEPFGIGEVQRFRLEPILESCGARLRRSSLVGVDADAHHVVAGDGATLPYDALLLATGARSRPTLPGALVFGGVDAVDSYRRLLEDLREREARSVLFILPHGATWPVPLYELALLTSAWLAARDVDAELTIATPESEPLELFGREASGAVGGLLREREISFLGEKYASAIEGGELRCAPGGRIRADRFVALPLLGGPALRGLPAARHGFVPTDLHGRVEGLVDVYAAGDATTFPLKQGGIAAAQADAAAEAIAAWAGAPVTPEPFKPVLRGLLLTGAMPKFLRVELPGDRSTVGEQPLWWPPSKIAGRYLSPFLASHAGLAVVAPPATLGLEVEVELPAES